MGDSTKLIYTVNETHYICKKEIFELIHQIHIAVGHGGKNRMIKKP